MYHDGNVVAYIHAVQMNKDQKLIGKYMLMLLYTDDQKPIQSTEHLEWMLFLLGQAFPETGLMEAMERERIRLEK